MNWLFSGPQKQFDQSEDYPRHGCDISLLPSHPSTFDENSSTLHPSGSSSRFRVRFQVPPPPPASSSPLGMQGTGCFSQTPSLAHFVVKDRCGEKEAREREVEGKEPAISPARRASTMLSCASSSSSPPALISKDQFAIFSSNMGESQMPAGPSYGGGLRRLSELQKCGLVHPTTTPRSSHTTSTISESNPGNQKRTPHAGSSSSCEESHRIANSYESMSKNIRSISPSYNASPSCSRSVSPASLNLENGKDENFSLFSSSSSSRRVRAPRCRQLKMNTPLIDDGNSITHTCRRNIGSNKCRQTRDTARTRRNHTEQLGIEEGRGSDEGVERKGRRQRAQRTPKGKIPLKADGSLYEYRWYTLKRRRVFVYNNKTYRGKKAYTMWEVVRKIAAEGGPPSHLSSSPTYSSSCFEEEGGRKRRRGEEETKEEAQRKGLRSALPSSARPNVERGMRRVLKKKIPLVGVMPSPNTTATTLRSSTAYPTHLVGNPPSSSSSMSLCAQATPPPPVLQQYTPSPRSRLALGSLCPSSSTLSFLSNNSVTERKEKERMNGPCGNSLPSPPTRRRSSSFSPSSPASFPFTVSNTSISNSTASRLGGKGTSLLLEEEPVHSSHPSSSSLIYCSPAENVKVMRAEKTRSVDFRDKRRDIKKEDEILISSDSDVEEEEEEVENSALEVEMVQKRTSEEEDEDEDEEQEVEEEQGRHGVAEGFLTVSSPLSYSVSPLPREEKKGGDRPALSSFTLALPQTSYFVDFEVERPLHIPSLEHGTAFSITSPLRKRPREEKQEQEGKGASKNDPAASSTATSSHCSPPASLVNPSHVDVIIAKNKHTENLSLVSFAELLEEERRVPQTEETCSTGVGYGIPFSSSTSSSSCFSPSRIGDSTGLGGDPRRQALLPFPASPPSPSPGLQFIGVPNPTWAISSTSSTTTPPILKLSLNEKKRNTSRKHSLGAPSGPLNDLAPPIAAVDGSYGECLTLDALDEWDLEGMMDTGEEVGALRFR